MTLQLVQTEDFLLDLKGQFRWYINQSKLEFSEAAKLAEDFKVSVLDTLEFLLKNPGIGRKRFPQFPDLEGTRSWRVTLPFNRFLIQLSCRQRPVVG